MANLGPLAHFRSILSVDPFTLGDYSLTLAAEKYLDHIEREIARMDPSDAEIVASQALVLSAQVNELKILIKGIRITFADLKENVSHFQNNRRPIPN